MNYLMTINFFILLLFVYTLFNKNFKRQKRIDSLEHYAEILYAFDRARESAYQKIYRDKILSYVTSNVKHNSKEAKDLQKEYITIVFKFCGDGIVNSLIDIHGSYDSIVAYLANDLMIKLGDSEVQIKQENFEYNNI